MGRQKKINIVNIAVKEIETSELSTVFNRNGTLYAKKWVSRRVKKKKLRFSYIQIQIIFKSI